MYLSAGEAHFNNWAKCGKVSAQMFLRVLKDTEYINKIIDFFLLNETPDKY